MKKTLIFLGGVITGGIVLTAGEIIWVTKKMSKLAKRTGIKIEEFNSKLNGILRSCNPQNMEELIECIIAELSEEEAKEMVSMLKKISNETNKITYKVEDKINNSK